MKRKTWILTLAASCAAGTLALASSGPSGLAWWPPQGFVRLHPLERQDAQPEQAPLDVAGWQARLCEPDLDRREQGFELAVEAALRDPRLQSELAHWARSQDDPGLAWTARLVLREVRQLERSAGRGSSWPWDGGLDWPPAGQPLGGWPALEDMLRDLDGLHGNLGELLREMERGGLAPLPGARSSASSSSVQLQITPDGVRCEVSSQEDGQEVTRKYEAATLEELLEQHPELRESVRPSLGQGGWLRGLGPGGAALGTSAGLVQPLRTDILGVVVGTLPAERALALGLEAGTGLSVERVEPGTLADALDVRRGHVLVELNGTELHTRDDISRVLAARDPGADVVLVLIDRWGQRRTRVWRPGPDEAEAPPADALTPRRAPARSS